MLNIRMERDRDKEQVKELWDICFGDPAHFVDWFFEERWMPSYGVVA